MTATRAPAPAGGRTPNMSTVLAWTRRPARGAVTALAVLVIANAVLTPHFAAASNFWNILLQVSSVALAAIGMTFVIGTGGVDLSVGSVMALSAAVAATRLDHGVGTAIVMALGAALAVGLVNGILIARGGIQPIVVTLATLIAGRGLAQIASNDGQLVSITSAPFEVLGRGHVSRAPIPVIIALFALAAGTFVLRATPLGRYVLAVGGNPVAARLAGVPVRRTLVTVYALSAVLAGIAGVLEASRLAASDAATIGLNMELDAIAAVVVGGTALTGGRATVLGSVIGALVMQVIATSFNMLLIPYAWSLVLKAAIIVVAVYLQRQRRA